MLEPSLQSGRRTVWLVCYYGALPGEGLRDYRCTFLARALVEQGYRVVWWVSSFNHVTKKQRGDDCWNSGLSHFEIRRVEAPAYRANISWGRVWSEWKFGCALGALVGSEPRPAAIILMEPARFYGNAVAGIARRTGANLILDVIDLWPELFEMLAPRRLRLLARAVLKPLYWQRRWLVNQARAVVGVTSDYVREVAGQSVRRPAMHVAYWGRHETGLEGAVSEAVRASVARDQGITAIVVYAGMLGNNYDISAIAAAAQRLRQQRHIRWVIAGDGPLAGIVRETAAALAPGQFIYLGLQDAATVAWIMQRADIGLCCYHEGSTVSMPLKVYDYLSAGLPIINSLGRELGQLTAERGIGLQYKAGDADSLAGAVSRLSDDVALRRRCADNARRLSAEFDPRRQHEAYVHFLRQQQLI